MAIECSLRASAGCTSVSALRIRQRLHSAGGRTESISLFRTDNRSRYDSVAFQVQHSFSKHFELSAHYTLSSAATWGATVGELADYVNGVSDVRRAFGPGDYGPSGEDVRHRFVLAGTLRLPGKVELITLSQFESARPYTLATPVDLNNDGLDSNDRAVVNGVQTSLDQLRGTPYYQIDLCVSRDFRWESAPRLNRLLSSSIF